MDPETDASDYDARCWALARILHDSGREAVEQRKIYRSDLPVKPFAEWDDLDHNTKDGRYLMAKYLMSKAGDVVVLLGGNIS